MIRFEVANRVYETVLDEVCRCTPRLKSDYCSNLPSYLSILWLCPLNTSNTLNTTLAARQENPYTLKSEIKKFFGPVYATSLSKGFASSFNDTVISF